MGFTKKEFDEIAVLFKKNENIGMEKLNEKLKIYITFYKNRPSLELENDQQFIEDTKLIFNLLYIIYLDENFVEEIKNDQEFEDIEKKEFLNFIDSLQKIHYLFLDPDFTFSLLEENKKLFDDVIAYLCKINKGVEDLSDTMKQMNRTLEKLEKVLYSIKT